MTPSMLRFISARLVQVAKSSLLGNSLNISLIPLDLTQLRNSQAKTRCLSLFLRRVTNRISCCHPLIKQQPKLFSAKLMQTTKATSTKIRTVLSKTRSIKLETSYNNFLSTDLICLKELWLQNQCLNNRFKLLSVDLLQSQIPKYYLLLPSSINLQSNFHRSIRFLAIRSRSHRPQK